MGLLRKNLSVYWSLYEEFIRDFKDIQYKDVPLALLINFYHLFSDEMIYQIGQPEFREMLKYPLEDHEAQPTLEKHIQDLYETSTMDIKVDKEVNKKEENFVLLNYRYLRLTEGNYAQCFDQEKTRLMVERGEAKDLYGIPIHNRLLFKQDCEEDIADIQKQIGQRMKELNHHALYKDSFFQETLLGFIPSMIDYISSIKCYLDQFQVSCIIVGTAEDLLSRVLVLLGGMKGIPSLCLVHGVLMRTEAYLPIFTDKLCIYGQEDKALLEEFGVRENQMEIIGHPRFDDIFYLEFFSREDLCQMTGLDPQKKIVLIGTQPFNPTIWLDVVEQLMKEQDIQIIFKPHPIEHLRNGMDYYDELAKKYKGIFVVHDWKIHLYNFIKHADVGIIQSSTIGLEMMLFNIPVCILKIDEYKFYESLDDLIFTDSKALSQYIMNILSNPDEYKRAQASIQKFLQRAYPQKSSGEKLKQLIESMGERGMREGEKT